MKLTKNGLSRLLAITFLFTILQTGCSSSIKKPLLLPIKPKIGMSEITDSDQFPDFRDDYGKQTLLYSISNSIAYFKRTKSYPDAFSVMGFSPEKLTETLKFFRDGYLQCKDTQELNEFVSKNFRVFKAIGDEHEGDVHFTGYGTPIYEGSSTQTEVFRYPLYRKPADFRRPYFTRREIEERNLLKGNEIVYLKSKLEAYLIHVQGSAQINLLSGRTIHVGSHANSGHKYTSIERLLVMDGKVPEKELTLLSLISYFEQHPDEIDFYLQQNDRYIFFKPVIYSVPKSSIGVPLTPLRSIATDKKSFPPCGLAFVVIGTKRPSDLNRLNEKVQDEKSFFALDQDTGSAFVTPSRADVFFGIGDEAMHKAGNLNAYGSLYYLLKK